MALPHKLEASNSQQTSPACPITCPPGLLRIGLGEHSTLLLQMGNSSLLAQLPPGDSVFGVYHTPPLEMVTCLPPCCGHKFWDWLALFSGLEGG